MSEETVNQQVTDAATQTNREGRLRLTEAEKAEVRLRTLDRALDALTDLGAWKGNELAIKARDAVHAFKQEYLKEELADMPDPAPTLDESVPPLKPEDITQSAVVFTPSILDKTEILRVDKDGLYYKGCLIMDAGAAHKAWLAAMRAITPGITASEALFGFTAWLTTRKESLLLGAAHDCVPVVELLKLFLGENKLPEPRAGIYPNNIKMPEQAKIGEQGK